jgi:hypothetical protein
MAYIRISTFAYRMTNGKFNGDVLMCGQDKRRAKQEWRMVMMCW